MADKRIANLLIQRKELVDYFTKQLYEINENLPIMKIYDIPCALGGLESVVNLKMKNIYEK